MTAARLFAFLSIFWVLEVKICEVLLASTCSQQRSAVKVSLLVRDHSVLGGGGG